MACRTPSVRAQSTGQGKKTSADMPDKFYEQIDKYYRRNSSDTSRAVVLEHACI